MWVVAGGGVVREGGGEGGDGTAIGLPPVDLVDNFRTWEILLHDLYIDL